MTRVLPATSAPRGVARSTTVTALARLGLAGHGAIYVLLGVLALSLAFGGRQQETDQRGALEELAQSTAGWLLLIVIAIGLAAYAAWRLLEAAIGVTGEPDGAGAKERAKSAVRGVIYAGFAVSAFAVVANGNTTSQAKSQQTWTARIMAHTGGRWLIGLVGVAVVVVGIVLVVRGARTKFEKHFPMASMSTGAQRATKLFGLVGRIARGVVVALVGILLVVAAVQFDPKQARGVDGALRELRDAPAGPVLLVAVALGLILFGLFGFCEARWRKL